MKKMTDITKRAGLLAGMVYLPLFLLNGYTLISACAENGWISAAGALLMGVFGLLFVGIKRKRQIPAGILFLLMIVLQILFVFWWDGIPRSDSFKFLEQAILMLDEHRISQTWSNGYFSWATNNYGITILTYWFLSICRFFGMPLSACVRAGQLLNVAYIDIAVFMMWKIICRFRDRKAGNVFLGICLVSPFVYVWAPYYYTATASMTFGVAAVYIGICIYDAGSSLKRVLLTVFLGLLAVTGFEVRATSLIAYIAWAVMLLFFAGRKQWIPVLKNAAVFAAAAALSLVLWNGLIRMYVPFDTTDTALPVMHYLMMGAQGNGSFNNDDLLYTRSLETAALKREGTRKVLEERLRENGWKGNIKILLEKQKNTWMDGTDACQMALSEKADYHRLHTYILGSRDSAFYLYAQCFRIWQLFLICFFCAAELLRILRTGELCTDRQKGSLLLALNLLGGMAFHLLWEAASVYSVPFTLFCYALMAEGMERMEEGQKRIGAAKLPVVLSAGTILVTAGIFLYGFRAAADTPQASEDYVINQHMYNAAVDSVPMKQGDVWEQTFVTAQPFNLLQLFYDTPGQEGNHSVYRVTLTDQKGNTYLDDEIHGSSTGYSIYYELPTEQVIPEGKEEYRIRVEAVQQDAEQFVRFGAQNTKYIDVYPEGELTVNGSAVGYDLAFRILNQRISPLFSVKEYAAAGFFCLLAEAGMLVLVLRRGRRGA